jgi:hypothetical protein
VPTGVFSLTITGTNFQSSSVATLGGKTLSVTSASATQIVASGFNSTSRTANLVVSNGAVSSAPVSLQLGPPNALVTVNAARHFLQQAAFGPTSAEAANVQQLGFQGWLNQQMAAPKVSNYAGIGNQSSFTNAFLTNAVNQPDQLRQRVAFALSEIMVVSDQGPLTDNGTCTSSYYDALLDKVRSERATAEAVDVCSVTARLSTVAPDSPLAAWDQNASWDILAAKLVLPKADSPPRPAFSRAGGAGSGLRHRPD